MSPLAFFRAIRDGWRQARPIIFWMFFGLGLLIAFLKKVVRPDPWPWGPANWDWEMFKVFTFCLALLTLCALLGLARREWISWQHKRRQQRDDWED